MLVHSRAVLYLLSKLQDVVAGGPPAGDRVVALFYAAVLCTEGVGVYLQQRWAELLMVLATAALIPLEVRHVWLHPGAVAILILAANCFIVWFLYRVLRRRKTRGTDATRARARRRSSRLVRREDAAGESRSGPAPRRFFRAAGQ